MGFMDTIERIGEKVGLSGGDSMQYLLAGTLILVIVISLISVFVGFSGDSPGEGGEPAEMKFFCLETNKEFTIKPEELNQEEMMDHPARVRVMSPYSNKRTGIQMVCCPECKKYYVPEPWKDPNYSNPDEPCKCPYCGTNREEWYRQKIKERRGR